MLNQIIKFLDDDQYDYYFVAFDAGKKTFRHTELDSYKENRSQTPDNLISQMVDCDKALNLLGITTMARDNVEADDLVGSFVNMMNENKIFVDVYSSDKDLLQLVNPLCNVNLMKTGVSVLETYTNDNFSEKFFNLTPLQVIEYKSIIGDKSDALPGVCGIGPKKGIDLLLKYKTLENIYEHLDELPESTKEKFINCKKIAFQCKHLATILQSELELFEPDDFRIHKADYESLSGILRNYNLHTIEDYLRLRDLKQEQ